MLNIFVNGVPYNLSQTINDDLSSTNVLQTVVEEGETPENKYRLNLPPYNPETLKTFANADEIKEFCDDVEERFWSPYFEDPAPDEGGE